ncbi:hypothetical protein EYF80_026089 [Liparis tanakae]|uniref:Uncharacterized protein n=1 Tax=Liparis tanakae TaxID=230148 RepID=A0A4Z2HDG5_9TELE|nr:hypothetical protein EYF80_026089 [Liparis tanakae]
MKIRPAVVLILSKHSNSPKHGGTSMDAQQREHQAAEAQGPDEDVGQPVQGPTWKSQQDRSKLSSRVDHSSSTGSEHAAVGSCCTALCNTSVHLLGSRRLNRRSEKQRSDRKLRDSSAGTEKTRWRKRLFTVIRPSPSRRVSTQAATPQRSTTRLHTRLSPVKVEPSPHLLALN